MPRPSDPFRAVALTALLLLLVSAPATAARGEGPADPLFKLVPPDALLTLSVEDLAGHARQAADSPVFEGLRRLPAVRKWLQSDGGKGLRAAMDRVEKLLGCDFATLRDGLLGEAVVLTLRLPLGAPPEEARGLLLARVPDPALLGRLIDGLNASQTRNGELAGLTEKTHGGALYRSRRFRQAGRPEEFYVRLPARVFAWSNSEELIRGVIDRHRKGTPGLADDPTFLEAQGSLPARALVRLHGDPKFAAYLLAAATPADDDEGRRAIALLNGYLAGVRRIAAALTWNEAPVLHVEERLDPENVAAALRRWASRDVAEDPVLLRVPPTAIALGSAHLDGNALADVLVALSEPGQLDELWTAGRGLALGLDLQKEVFPHLGPWASCFVETPPPFGVGTDETRLPTVLTVQVARTPEGVRAAGALDNALRTVLALGALDPKNAAAGLRLETRSESGTTVTALGGGGGFAYGLTEGRLLLGSSADAVGRALAAQADPRAGDRFAALRARGFPGASSFGCLDLGAILAFAEPRRAELAGLLARRQNRDEADALADLDQVLSLIGLFDAAYVTSTVAPDFSRSHRTFGLIPRAAGAADTR